MGMALERGVQQSIQLPLQPGKMKKDVKKPIVSQALTRAIYRTKNRDISPG